MSEDKPGPHRRRLPIPLIIFLAAAGAWVVLNIGLEVRRSVTDKRAVACNVNVKLLTLALQTYLADNDDVFPPGGRWSDLLAGYVEGASRFTCPEAHNRVCSYAFNRALSGAAKPASADWSEVIAIFESDAGWNAFGGPELLPSEPRHFGGEYVGLVSSAAGWKRRLRGRAQGRHGVWLKAYDPLLVWHPSPR